MKRMAFLVALVALAHGASADTVIARGVWDSPLALARVGGEGEPSLLLAQRAIDREWPAPGDSGLTVLPDGRSEISAMLFSAAVPGSGQVYAGSLSGLYFAAAEIAGWFGLVTLRHGADDLREEARVVAGVPDDTTSAWSFNRYEEATQQPALRLRALYAADRDAFDQAIDDDPRYAVGWVAPQAHAEFSDLRGRSDEKLVLSRATAGAIWLNHVVAAFDALRVARLANRSLGHGLELKAKGSLHRGRPEMVVTLERRF